MKIALPYSRNVKIAKFYKSQLAIFNEIGEEYATRFSSFHISRQHIKEMQNDMVMSVRPSMQKDIGKCDLRGGLSIYSMWQGYRDNDYQQKFEQYLKNANFTSKAIHTSGHTSVSDIKRLIAGLDPKKIVPIHTMQPNAFKDYSDKVELQKDGVEFGV